MRKETEQNRSDLFNQISSYMESLPEAKFNTLEEDIALAKKVSSGDLDAKQKLFNSVSRMVVQEAIRRGWEDEDMVMDLISEGNLAVWEKAIEGYDPQKGVKFITYATEVVRHTQDRAKRKMRRAVNISEEMELTAGRVRKLSNDFLIRNGHEPSPKELQSLTGLTPYQVVLALEVANQQTVSLDKPDGKEDEDLIESIYLEDDAETDFLEPAEYEAMKQKINFEIRRLEMMDAKNENKGNHTRMAEILKMRLGIQDDGSWDLGLSAKEIAGKLGICRERVQQIQSQAIDRVYNEEIRKSLRSLLLRRRHV